MGEVYALFAITASLWAAGQSSFQDRGAETTRKRSHQAPSIVDHAALSDRVNPTASQDLRCDGIASIRSGNLGIGSMLRAQVHRLQPIHLLVEPSALMRDLSLLHDQRYRLSSVLAAPPSDTVEAICMTESSRVPFQASKYRTESAFDSARGAAHRGLENLSTCTRCGVRFDRSTHQGLRWPTVDEPVFSKKGTQS